MDVADRGVRGRARAKVLDDSEYAVKILTQNLMRYMVSTDSSEAKDRIEIAKNNYSAIEITPLFMVTWKT